MDEEDEDFIISEIIKLEEQLLHYEENEDIIDSDDIEYIENIENLKKKYKN